MPVDGTLDVVAFDLAELLDVIEHLLMFTRAGSMHALEGETEAAARARRVVDRHGSSHAG